MSAESMFTVAPAAIMDYFQPGTRIVVPIGHVPARCPAQLGGTVPQIRIEKQFLDWFDGPSRISQSE